MQNNPRKASEASGWTIRPTMTWHRSENNCLDSIVAITLRRDVPQEMLDSYFPNDAW